VNYIIIVGVFQALMALCLAIFVSVRKSDDRDDVLSLLLIAILLHLSSTFILNVFFPGSEIHKQFNTFIALLYPVLLWCYTSRLAGFQKGWERRDLLHFVPAGLTAIWYFIIAAYTIAHNGKTPAIITPYNSISGYICIFLYAVYPLKCIKALRIIPSFWTAEKRFVTFALTSFLTLSAYSFLLLILVRIYPSIWVDMNLHFWTRIILYFLLLLICGFAVFIKVHALYILQVDGNTQHSQPSNEFSSLPVPTIKKQPISGIDYIGIVEKMERLMVNEKVYTNSELTLDELAVMIAVSRHHLSESINQFIGKTFYQYINEYRINQVVVLMDKHKDSKVSPNILSLAFEAGFHSKSSFNQYFKKVIGCTPSAYMRKMLEK